MWRVIKSSYFDAFTNMALDEVLLKKVAEDAQPIIRFYKWKPSAVSIGYFQSIKKEVNLLECNHNSIDVVRRTTGGGAVYHDSLGELTYSVIAKEELFPKGIIDSYKLICSWIINGLKELNIESNFVPINDIVVNGKKISGNAQTRRNKVLLQHGTILFDLNVKKMFSFLKVNNEKVSDKLINSVEERVTRVKDFGVFSINDLEEVLINSFTKGKDFVFSNYSKEELLAAEILAREKYASFDWNFWR